jgi:hypothetical protein
MENNWDYTYKVNNVGLVSPRGPLLFFKRPESPKIGKIILKMGNVRPYLVITT